MRRLPPALLLTAIATIGSCTSASPPETPSASAVAAAATPVPTAAVGGAATPATAPPASGPQAPAVSFRGATFAMEVDPEMRSFFADRGALVAVSSKDGPSPFASKILLAEPARGPWREVYASDAMYNVVAVADGFVAILEYRQQGGGAYSQKLVLIDLPSGRPQVVDSYALSAATFRGGGGGPPRPTGSMVLGSGLIAWVRLVEGSGGTITGELRVGLPHLSGEARLVARSDVLIRPVAIVDATTLVYVIGVDRGVELRAREISSGAERVLATGQLSTVGVVPFTWAARSGPWIAWIEETPSPSSTLRAVELKTGATHAVPLGQSYCPGLTGNARYLAVNCSGQTAPSRMVLLETGSWTEVPVARTTANGPFFLAAGGITDLLWQDRTDGRRRVVLFTPTTPMAAAGPFRDLVSRENASLGYRIGLPSRYRLALSVAEQGNVGRDFYTPRTEEDIREVCRRGGGIGSQGVADIQVVVHPNVARVSPVDFISGPRRAIFTAIERVTIGGYDAARVVHLPSGDTAYYVISANDRLYELAPSVLSQPSPPELTSAGFDQIAATFTAIPFKPVASPPSRQTLC